MSQPSPYPAPGEIIDGAWRVEKILGEGGMGAVALAWDLFLHTPVAIKFMNPQFLTFPGAEQRFLNEGRASALIKSDHVVPVTKAGKTAGGTPFLVMEALEGLDLADVIARDGTPGLPIVRTIHFTMQVLRALQAAHAIGIIHRDMKPSNCFVVTKDGEPDFVKILDFGISKVQQPGSASLTQTNSALGTPLYMSPEQARSPRDVDMRSDLYSVGVIVYELLTGHTPFFSESGEFTEILFKLFTADAPPVQSTRPDIPDELAAVVHKALAREVENRFASAVEMAEALAPWADESSLAVLARMRGFKAPVRGSSIAPPQDLPESMQAFSQLTGAGASGGSTGVMPNRPTTDVMKSPPVTEILPHAPGGAVIRVNDGGGVQLRTQQLSPSAGAPARQLDDATSRTQFDSGGAPAYTPSVAPTPSLEASSPGAPGAVAARTPPPGGSTDLGAARDAIIEGPGSPKRSPLVYALPVVALLGIGLGVAALSSSSNGKKPTTGNDPAATSVAADLPPSATAIKAETTAVTAPPVTASASASPSASPSASASASVSVSAQKLPGHPPHPPPPQTAQPPQPGGTSALDTKAHF